MENVTRAIIMAFSMLIFVIGFSYSMYLINSLTTTSNTLLSSVNTKSYYDNIKVSGQDTTTRDVGIDTIISTLYRYYKENYAVKIYDGNTLIQVFDVNLEGKIANAYDGYEGSDEELKSLSKSEYSDKTEKAYLFGAPWTGNTDGTYEHARARIYFFLNGIKGYINDILVDYSENSSTGVFSDKGGFIANYGNRIFKESFVEYAYEGETISTEEGVETITGNTQENSKIIITYTVK